MAVSGSCYITGIAFSNCLKPWDKISWDEKWVYPHFIDKTCMSFKNRNLVDPWDGTVTQCIVIYLVFISEWFYIPVTSKSKKVSENSVTSMLNTNMWIVKLAFLFFFKNDINVVICCSHAYNLSTGPKPFSIFITPTEPIPAFHIPLQVPCNTFSYINSFPMYADGLADSKATNSS